MGDSRVIILDALQEINENYTSTVFDHPFDVSFPVPAQCPYTFAAKTVGDVADFLLKPRDRIYSSRYSSGSRLSWNVKVHSCDPLAAVDYSVCDRALDSAWTAFLDSKQGQYVHEIVFSGAQEYYRNDWTAYPGDDQGDWKFFFGGRSGGWLCLESWRGKSFTCMSADSYSEFIAGLIDDYMLDRNDGLVRFYAGIVTADQDFTPTRATQEVNVQYAFQRELWEERRHDFKDELRNELSRTAKHVLESYGYSLTPELGQTISQTAQQIEESVK